MSFHRRVTGWTLGTGASVIPVLHIQNLSNLKYHSPRSQSVSSHCYSPRLQGMLGRPLAFVPPLRRSPGITMLRRIMTLSSRPPQLVNDHQPPPPRFAQKQNYPIRITYRTRSQKKQEKKSQALICFSTALCLAAGHGWAASTLP
jgi:hypothetical protein